MDTKEEIPEWCNKLGVSLIEEFQIIRGDKVLYNSKKGGNKFPYEEIWLDINENKLIKEKEEKPKNKKNKKK
jgi:hypothetical protein